MSNTILIDGQNFTDSTRFPDGFQVTYAIDDSSKTVNVGISSGIVFERDAFNYLENLFFPQPFNAGAKDREATVTITTPKDLCNEQFVFIIRADAVTYCPQECTIETQGFERSDDLKASDRLRNYQILTAEKPNSLISRISPKIQTCIEANFFQVLLYIVFLSMLAPFQAVANAFGWTALVLEIEAFLQKILGCHGAIRTFYIRDILEEIGTDTSITIQSSIFQTQANYSNAAWLDTQAIARITNQGNYSNPDQSSLFADGFLDLLGGVFNADWRIKDGVLVFERVDFFLQTSVTLINADVAYGNGNNLAEDAPCYTYTDQVRAAYGRYAYTEDNEETLGNEALNLYNDIIDFNDPFDQNKAGGINITVPIAAARFAKDQFRKPLGIDDFWTIGDLAVKNDLPYTRSLPKILIINGSAAATSDTNWTHAKVVSRVVGNDTQFNYPMFMTEGDSESLYENFWKITDPRETPAQPYQLEDFKFCGTCDQIRAVRENGIDILVETNRLGSGTPSEIVIDFDKHTITVKGTKLAQI